MKFGRPSKLDAAKIDLIRSVARARQERSTIPSNAELAEMLNVHRRTIDYWLADEREQIRAEAAQRAREAHNHFNATRGLNDEHSQC